MNIPKKQKMMLLRAVRCARNFNWFNRMHQLMADMDEAGRAAFDAWDNARPHNLATSDYPLFTDQIGRKPWAR